MQNVSWRPPVGDRHLATSSWRPPLGDRHLATASCLKLGAVTVAPYFRVKTKLRLCLYRKNTGQLGYNVLKGTEYFVSL
jgi:hypothetical protein